MSGADWLTISTALSAEEHATRRDATRPTTRHDTTHNNNNNAKERRTQGIGQGADGELFLGADVEEQMRRAVPGELAVGRAADVALLAQDVDLAVLVSVVG